MRLKWGTLGSNLLKCPRGQMGTKPAKVGHLAATLLKYVQKTKTKIAQGYGVRTPVYLSGFDLKAGALPSIPPR